MYAIESLAPNSDYVIFGDEYSGIEWRGPGLKPSEEEVNKKIEDLKAEEPMSQLRDERNRRLAECDWVVTKALESGSSVASNWKTYRQQLRDLPSSASPQLDNDENLTNVTWPTKPS